MSDPLISGALSSSNGDNLLSCGVLSTPRRHIRIPAKIPQYSNDCLGVSKRRTCEIFANDEVLSGAFRVVDLGFGEAIDSCEEVRERGAVALFDSSELV
jgi:hypothetical protein